MKITILNVIYKFRFLLCYHLMINLIFLNIISIFVFSIQYILSLKRNPTCFYYFLFATTHK